MSVAADKHRAFTLRRYGRRIITLEFTTGRTIDCAAKVGCTFAALTSTNLKTTEPCDLLRPEDLTGGPDDDGDTEHEVDGPSTP
ncbi:MAG: hypothetical protein ACLPVY_22780 [Acidimicrobiia bacterium]